MSSARVLLAIVLGALSLSFAFDCSAPGGAEAFETPREAACVARSWDPQVQALRSSVRRLAAPRPLGPLERSRLVLSAGSSCKSLGSLKLKLCGRLFSAWRRRGLRDAPASRLRRPVLGASGLGFAVDCSAPGGAEAPGAAGTIQERRGPSSGAPGERSQRASAGRRRPAAAPAAVPRPGGPGERPGAPVSA